MGSFDDDDSLHDEGLQQFTRLDDDDWSVVQTGVGHLKKRSFPTDSSVMTHRRKNATDFQTIGDVGHKRRKLGVGERTPPLVQPNSPSFERLHPDCLLDHILNKSGDKQIMSDASDLRQGYEAEDDDVLDIMDQQYTDYLYQRIQEIQNRIDGHPTTSSRDSEHGNLKPQLQQLKVASQNSHPMSTRPSKLLPTLSLNYSDLKTQRCKLVLIQSD